MSFLVLTYIFTGVSSLCGEEIKHIFIAVDESRKQVLYVDQFDPSNDWTISIRGCRDLQMIDNGVLLLSVPTGYEEYDISTGKQIKKVSVKGANAVQTALRYGEKTYLANSSTIWTLDADDKVINVVKINMGRYLRLLRIAKNGNFLFTAGFTVVKEADHSGKIVREIDLKKIEPNTQKPYFFKQQPNGNYMVSTGYGASLLILSEDGKLLRKIGGKGNALGVNLNFFGKAQTLSNGNIVVANWTGHNPNDSYKAAQIIEFDNEGKIVWKWHDPKRAGSCHGVVVLK
jgi:hypothetical protein